MSVSSYKNISSFVERFIPSYVNEDYPVFVEFIQEYFKSLEDANGPYRILFDLLDQNNPELADLDYLKILKDQIDKRWPITTLEGVDLLSDNEIRVLARNIVNYNRKKGNDGNFDYLFRTLFDSDVSVSYLRRNVNAITVEYVEIEIFSLTVPDAPTLFLNNRLVLQDKGTSTISDGNINLGQGNIYDFITTYANGLSDNLYRYQLHLTDVTGYFYENAQIVIDGSNEIVDVATPTNIVKSPNGLETGTLEYQNSDGSLFVERYPYNDLAIGTTQEDFQREFIYYLETPISYSRYINLVKDLIHPIGYTLFVLLLNDTSSSEVNITPVTVQSDRYIIIQATETVNDIGTGMFTYKYFEDNRETVLYSLMPNSQIEAIAIEDFNNIPLERLLIPFETEITIT